MRWWVLATVGLSACGGGGAPGPPITVATPTPSPSATATPDPDPLIAAAGDIACGTDTPRSAPCRQMETSELLIELRPAAVLALGDIQYEFGQYQDFLRFFDVSWGRLRPLLRPAPGNHEYTTRDANGYFDYFNGQGRTGGVAGNRGEGWYSFEVGSWHLVSLNSNCAEIASGCGGNSPQLRWLRADLAASRAACTLAFWHHPRFSSGKSQNDRTTQAFWDALYEANADVVLVGHDHGYERFAPQNPSGQPDAARGLRQFVVGTGGHSFQDFAATLPNSEARNNTTFGVIKMRLRPGRYEWAFEPIPGGTFTDSSSGACH
jgi:hypothetical protein